MGRGRNIPQAHKIRAELCRLAGEHNQRIYREQETGGSSMTVAPKLSEPLKARAKATIVWAVTHLSGSVA